MYLSNREKDLFNISSSISLHLRYMKHEIKSKHRMKSVNTIFLFILSGPQQFQNRVNCLCFAWPLAAAINDECHESKETFLKKFIFDKKHWLGMRYNRDIQSDTDYAIHKGWRHLTRWCILWQAYNCKEKAQKFVRVTANHCKSSHNMQYVSYYY